MLAVGLGWAAVEAGYRVHYTTAADLAARCHKAALEGRWANVMRFYAGPRLLIVDEVGYLPLVGEAAAALFQVVTRRYLKGSIALTTNLGVSSWGQTFDDPMVAAAMLDRLLHKSVVFNINGESYRMRAHRARAEATRRAPGSLLMLGILEALKAILLRFRASTALLAAPFSGHPLRNQTRAPIPTQSAQEVPPMTLR